MLGVKIRYYPTAPYFLEEIYSVTNEVNTTVITLPMILVDEAKGIFEGVKFSVSMGKILL